MKKIFLIFIAISSIWALTKLSLPESDPLKSNSNLPWQITTNMDGNSQIFGITLNQSTIGEVNQLVRQDREVAIIVDQTNVAALEIYYGHFATGPLKGKLVISTTAYQAELQQLIRDAPAVNFTKSGKRQFMLGSAQLAAVDSQIVSALTFIPSAQLDDAIIIGRFGQPAKIIAVNDGSSHYLYPDLGLDIELNSEGKEILQYIAPRDFDILSAPLYEIQQ